jgi:glycosyltransferase involved in cell wall biosynthesis
VITVVTPTFNRDFMLKETLHYNLMQSNSSFLKFLVVDNGSVDKTEEYLLEFKQHYAHILNVITHRHLDFRSVFLFAIEQVTTEWMVLLSDEDKLNSPQLADVFCDINTRSDVAYVSGIARYGRMCPIEPWRTFESSRHISGSVYRTDFVHRVIKDHRDDINRYEIFFLWPQYRIAIDAVLQEAAWWPSRTVYHLNTDQLPSVVRASSGNEYEILSERISHALSFNEFCSQRNQSTNNTLASKERVIWDSLINANKIYAYHSVRHEMRISRWLRIRALFYMVERRMPKLLRSLIARF